MHSQYFRYIYVHVDALPTVHAIEAVPLTAKLMRFSGQCFVKRGGPGISLPQP